MIKSIPLFKVFTAPEAIDLVKEVLESAFTGQSPKVELFEKEVRKIGCFTSIIIREILKSPGDQAKPSDYRSLDSFWDKRGFKKMEGISQQEQWTVIGDDTTSSHTMIYQVKNL